MNFLLTVPHHIGYTFPYYLRNSQMKIMNFPSISKSGMMTLSRTKVSTILWIQFIPVGIHLTSSKVRETLIIVVMNALFFIVAYSLLRNYSYLESYSYKMDITVYLVATIFIFNTFWISRYQKLLMVKILGVIAENEKHAEFAQLIQHYLKPLLLRVTSWHTSALCLIMILPIFTVCFTDAELGSTPTLLFPSWFPWKTHTTSQYVLTILLQLVSGSVLYFITLSQEIIVVCYAAVLQAHIYNFCKSVQEWDRDLYVQRRTRMFKENITDGKTIIMNHEDMTMRRFRKVLAHFFRIRGFVNDIVVCCTPFAANSLFIFFDGSVLLTAMLVQKENDFFYRMKMLAGELLGCAMFGVFCYLGDIINHMSEVCRDAVYNTRWYYESPRLRKRIHIFMQLTQKSPRMKAFQMYTIEIMFFAKIIKLCFSLLQVLLKLQN